MEIHGWQQDYSGNPQRALGAISGTWGNVQAQDNAYIHLGHNIEVKINPGDNRFRLQNLLLPSWQSTGSLELQWDHCQARNKRSEGTRKWFECSIELDLWLREPLSLFWLRGLPGCGKTVLSSTLIDSDPLKGRTIAAYYFNSKEAEKRTYSRFIRSILIQLCPPEGDTCPEIEDLYKMNLSSRFSDGDLVKAIQALLERQGQTFIIIDALDECDAAFLNGEKSEIEKVLDLLNALVTSKPPGLHILVTSRPSLPANSAKSSPGEILKNSSERGFCQHMMDLETGQLINTINSDIRKFLTIQLLRWNQIQDRSWLPLTEEMATKIEGRIMERANGMFRLAACLLDLLWTKGEWEDVKAGLEDLPSELSQVYNRILDDVKARNRTQEARLIVHLLLYCERPWTVEELREATMTRLGDASSNPGTGEKDKDFVSRIIPSFFTRSEDDYIQLSHQTVKEYLLSGEAKDLMFKKATDTQCFVAGWCLSYLEFYGKAELSYRAPGYQKIFALVEYCLNNWHMHALGGWERKSPDNHLEVLALSTDRWGMQQPITSPSTLAESKMFCGLRTDCQSERRSQSLQNWSASVKASLDLIRGDEYGVFCNALKKFASKGYEIFTSLALNLKRPDGGDLDTIYQKSFFEALAGRYEIMVQILLDLSMNVARNDPWWRQDFAPVANEVESTCESHTEIVKLLMLTGVDINKPDRRGWTGLHIATFHGNLTTVQLLLESSADVHARTPNGQTALHIAAHHGYDLITDILLRNNARTTLKDICGWIALNHAVQKMILDFTKPGLNRHSSHEATARTIQFLLESETREGTNRNDNCTVHAHEILGGVETLSSIDIVYGDCVKNKACDFDPELPKQSIKFATSLLGCLLICGKVTPIVSLSIPAKTLGLAICGIWAESLYRDLGLIPGGREWTMHHSEIPDFQITCESPVQSIDLIDHASVSGEYTVTFQSSHFQRILVDSKVTVSFQSPAMVDQAFIGGESAVTFQSSTLNIRQLHLNNKAIVNFTSPAVIDQASIVRESTVTFQASTIRQLHLNDKATATFQSPVVVDQAFISGESATTVQSSHIGKLSLDEKAYMMFVSGFIDKASISGKVSTTFQSSHIGKLWLDGKVQVMFVSVVIDEASIFGNVTATFISSRIRRLHLADEASVDILSDCEIETLHMLGGSLNLPYAMHRFTMELLLKGNEPDMETVYEHGTTRIQQIHFNGGVFYPQAPFFSMTVNNRHADAIGFLDKGTGPLYYAVSRGQDAIVRLLIQHGANPNALISSSEVIFQVGSLQEDSGYSGTSGSTMLHVAVAHGFDTVLNTLLELGADVSIADNKGRTAIQIALLQGNTSTIDILQRAEAK